MKQAEAQAAVEEAQLAARAAGQELTQQQLDDIYLGFSKGDYGPRAGRKGRFIKDDPKKYPSKENLGLFVGATGGWAGGEAALWKLRESVKAESSGKSAAPASARKEPAPAAPSPDAIYLGFGKDELAARKQGARGRFIVDDPQKYPAKEDLGVLRGATGGFAGGEKGLQMFVQEGEVKLRPKGQRSNGWQFEPVSVAGLLALAGAGGGLLLTDITDLGEKAVDDELQQLSQAPIDDNTKLLLITALALLGSVGLMVGARAAVQSVSERLRGAASNATSQAQRLVVTGAFGVALFFAARAVLEL